MEDTDAPRGNRHNEAQGHSAGRECRRRRWDRRPDRSESWLGADQIVIAAHAIEGPKLLLMSRSEQLPNGVSNSSGAVGRYLMDHPVQLTRALSPVPVWQPGILIASILELATGI